MKILVTGANGQLGSELRRIAETSGKDEFTFVDLAEMDLGSDDAIAAFFTDKVFDFIINCAAYTAVDQAEKDIDLAYRVNAEAVRALAEICARKKIRLIHISTDYVFDGKGNEPISEDVQPNPISVYGKSKLAGERYVRQILNDAYIIRTAWVYSTFGKNFVKTIARLARERDTLNVVYDQVGSPTYARDLAVTLLAIVQKVNAGVIDKPGTYHYTNEGVISWYDFAVFIVKYFNLPCRICPIPAKEYKTLAERPTFSVLDKSRLKNTFAIEIPHWHESLVDCMEELTSE
ncbi:MAG TPA: dTDP-4-dehydrorhamnose reductase [Chryseolinea sp.]|nr:dTDP-4-dehydrorhamnose reductase [Chryseolinea sp.]